jgi:general L-amino acid transport system substrate-binding protein
MVLSAWRAVWLAVIILAVAAVGPAAPTGSVTLDGVRKRNVLRCGVPGDLPGFSMPDASGVQRGMDADTCRAVAAAVLGDANRVRFFAVNAQTRFAALQSGAIDLLLSETTWTLGREARAGLMFVAVTYYDGTGFLVKRSAGVTSALQLSGASVCVEPSTTTELAVADYFRLHGMNFSLVAIADGHQMEDAFLSGRCDVFANDTAHLAGFRAGRGEHAVDFILLPEIISHEPLGPMVRKGDDRWFDIVRWTFFAQVTAEEAGVSSRNVDSFATSRDPATRRLLGLEGDLGRALGLDQQFAYNVIKQVGNYGEVWDAAMAPAGIARGLNNLWTKGGLQYAPPFR